MELTLHRVEEREFDALEPQWNDLLARSASDNFFLRWEWIHTWWHRFKTHGRSLCLVAAREANHLVGLAPLYIDRVSRFPKVRMLRFCSDELAPDYLDFIVDKGKASGIFQALWEYFTRQETDWDIMILEDLLKDSVVLQNVGVFAAQTSRTDPFLSCPYIATTGSFEAYGKQQQKTKTLSFRELARKQRRLFEKDGFTHSLVKEQQQLSKAIEELFLLHAQRAAQKGLRSNFTSQKVQDFHVELASRLLKTNMLELEFLRQNGTPVAVIYSFRYRNKLYEYQKGMDPQWHKWSVGMVLQKIMAERAFTDGLTEVDLLKGEEPYKAQWANGIREQKQLTVYNRTAVGRLLQGRDGLKTSVKKLIGRTETSS